MKELKIIFKGKKAEVYLTKEAYEKRMNGLVQYLATFCSNIEYKLIKETTRG